VRTEETLTAGVPEMQKLVETASRTLGIDQKAADAARHDNPKTLSASLDVTESEICAHFVGLARQRRESCEESLAKLQLDRKATAAKIDLGQTRDAFARLLTAVEPNLEKLKSSTRPRSIRPRRTRPGRSSISGGSSRSTTSTIGPRRTRRRSCITSRSWPRWRSSSGCPWPPFYAEGSDFGLLGGVLIAMTLSIVNISLAILSGSLLRYVNHRSAGRKALGPDGRRRALRVLLHGHPGGLRTIAPRRTTSRSRSRQVSAPGAAPAYAAPRPRSVARRQIGVAALRRESRRLRRRLFLDPRHAGGHLRDLRLVQGLPLRRPLPGLR
jgi:hypothetical protein